jgi:feruloyl esterase
MTIIRITALAVAGFCVGLTAYGGPAASERARQAEVPMACQNLGALELPNTDITLAEIVPAGGFVQPEAALVAPGQPPPSYDHLSAFCRVVATISPVPDSEIESEVWMPAQGWNGKFVGTGNGGFSGAIWHFAMSEPLARGYAVANTDTGHQGGAADVSFAIGHPEKLADHAWRAVREMTVQSKAIIAARYGRLPRAS